MRRLIEGSIQDKGYYVPYVADIYEGLESNLYLAVADITKFDSTHTQLTHIRDLLKRTQPDFKYFIYSNYIVIIMSSDETTFYEKKGFKKLNHIFTKYRICAGISSCFDNLYESKKQYGEAIKALNNGLETNGNQQIFLYADA